MEHCCAVSTGPPALAAPSLSLPTCIVLVLALIDAGSKPACCCCCGLGTCCSKGCSNSWLSWLSCCSIRGSCSNSCGKSTGGDLRGPLAGCPEPLRLEVGVLESGRDSPILSAAVKSWPNASGLKGPGCAWDRSPGRARCCRALLSSSACKRLAKASSSS